MTLPPPSSPATAQPDVLESSRALAAAMLAATEGDAAARERRIAFQALIAELATGFIGIGGSELDSALGRTLERIATLAGAEGALFVRLEPPDDTVVVSHEWTSIPAGAKLSSLHGRKAMRWSMEKLRTGAILHFEDAAAIPSEAQEERSGWEFFGLQSILSVPVRSDAADLLGFAVFVTMSRKAGWKKDELPLFHLAAEMLRSAFEQQELRARLERSELRLQRLLESASIGILSVDANGRIWEANDSALMVVGATRADVDAGRLRWDKLTPPEFLHMTTTALGQVESSGSSQPWEQDIYRRDGSRVSVLLCLAGIAETPDQMLVYAVDITVDKQAQQELALRNRLARLITLFSTRLVAVSSARIGETMEDAMREVAGVLGIDRCSVWIDVEEGSNVSRCTHVWDRSKKTINPSSAPTVDRSRFPRWIEDFRSRRPMIVRDTASVFPEDAPERAFLETYGTRSGVAVPLAAGESSIGFVIFGSARVVEWPENTISLLCVIGEIFAAAIVRGRIEEKQRLVHDQLEKGIAERTLQLESANRELEAFSYAVSHDLRAPLRGVDGFSRILVEDHAEGLPAGAKSVLDRIRATSQRMGDLIDALLRLSRITRLEPQFSRVDLSAIVRELAASIAASEPARLVEFRIQDGLVVDGEPRLLTAVIENLLRNAWKFTAPTPHAHIEFGVERGDDGRTFYVRDDGVGFDQTQAERIFTPFQRLHDPRDFEGNGVGLATVKRIIRVHGGRVWATGEPGNGATFRFTLAERT